MSLLITSCASIIASTYNTRVGSTALVVATNCFAGVVPDKPDSLVTVLTLPGFADRTQPVRNKEFQVVCRGKHYGVVEAAMRIINEELDTKVNLIPGFCGRIKAQTEDPEAGYDKEGRIIFTQQFVLTTK